MDEYLTQNKLSWKKIKIALALLDTEWGRAGMTKIDIKNLSGRIYHAGSLVNVIKQLEKEKEKLQSEIDRLATGEQALTNSNIL